MKQHDCPFIDTTVASDVSFSAVHWEFDDTATQLETRMSVTGEDPTALDRGLDRLRDHENMRSFVLQNRRGDSAQIRTRIDETDAMGRIRDNDGFITGPFHIDDGSEIWHVGFDTPATAEETLSELDRNNEFVVLSREQFEKPLIRENFKNVNAGLQLIEQCKQLTTVERDTLEAAVREGYFESPRETSLGSLADEFDISKPAASKNLRRGQLKITRGVVDALDYLEESIESETETETPDGETDENPL